MRVLIQSFILFLVLWVLVDNFESIARMFEARQTVNKSIDKARKALKGE